MKMVQSQLILPHTFGVQKLITDVAMGRPILHGSGGKDGVGDIIRFEPNAGGKEETMRQSQANQTPISELIHKHPHCATEQQSVGDLVSLFLDSGISAVPVVDNNGKPIGFVSKTDVLRQLKGQHSVATRDSNTLVQPWWDAERLSQLTVKAIMTPAVYTCLPTTTVADAAAVMAFEGMHHLPVVAESGELVGMLSALDVLDWFVRQAGYKPAAGTSGQVFERPA